ncbi:hypothetical protein CAPTEDRAFT_201113 [Capitella teleta]|uniref:Uncharacterized protein n=1 Tax=Capitella teleta TaxID=283909 RepID=R7VJ18_CAPTE|nr:hypothetical protein CAPTEDRAFT_201113 [Capitella teleta]|eukprot:ELU15695.1 hypothetical protein CAPTEDRAFT_201113 [Capitella teleta]
MGSDPPMIILSNVLAYAAYGVATSTSDHTKEACVDFFSSEEIIDARDLLWGKCENGVLPKMIKRQNTTTKKGLLLTTSDIIEAIQKLGDSGSMPIFAVEFSSLGRLPLAKPSGKCPISLCERMAKLEARARTSSVWSLESAASKSDAPTEGFEFDAREKRRRMRRRRSAITGKKKADECRLKGAPAPKRTRDIFVYQVENSMIAADLEDYMKECGVEPTITSALPQHWGLTDQLRDLESRLDNARVYGKSGMDESQPLVGRPHGGCAVIVRKDLKCPVEPVTTMNKRLFSCLIRLPVSWSKASEEDIADYKHVLSYLLEQVIPPSLRGCIGSGFSCDSENHRGLIEHYFETISSACLAAAEVCIPKQGGRKRVAGWNDHVETFKGASIMWHRIWDANGKPGNGVVYDLMLKAKREYKSAVRWVLWHQDELSSMRMADGILNNKRRDLWAEVKKKTHSRCSTPGIVDRVEGDHEIGELFCAKFDELYNCVSYNADEMRELKHSVFDLVSSRRTRRDVIDIALKYSCRYKDLFMQ